MIAGFHGQHRFLSNFFPSPITYEGITYGTLEHAFQAAKTTEPVLRQLVRDAMHPAEARRLGRRVILRAGWNEMREQVMLDLLRIKFSNEELAQQLIDTGIEELIEVNHHHDTFWGVCQGEGQNKLGQLLMIVRQELNDQINKAVRSASRYAYPTTLSTLTSRRAA